MEHGKSGTPSGPLPLFCARLKRLQAASGTSQSSLATAAHLSTSQMSDILNGKIKRPPAWNITITVVRACLEHAAAKGKPVPPDLRDEQDWRCRYGDLEHDLDAESRPTPHRETALGVGGSRPPGAVRVQDADPLLLGVHRPIDVEGAAGDWPTYVMRDTDLDPRGVRAAFRDAVGAGGMVLLVGGSSVGKSRCALEALRALVPDWWLLHPADAGAVRDLAADMLPGLRVVVGWMSCSDTWAANAA